MRRPSPKEIFEYVALMLAFLWSVAEQGRTLVPDSRRVYASLIITALIHFYMLLKGKASWRRAGLVLLTSFMLPLISVPIALWLRSDEEGKAEATVQLRLLDLMNSSTAVVCRSSRLANGLLADIAREASNTRRVVLVDWFGDLSERLEHYRVAKPSDIWLGDPGYLGEAYFLMASDILNIFLEIPPSFLIRLLKHRDFEMLNDVKIPLEVKVFLEGIFSKSGIPLVEALPEVAGVLVVDASQLTPQAQEALSLLILLQAASLKRRDFLVLVPSISPWEGSKGKEVLRWLINSLKRGGGVIGTKFLLREYAKEFDYLLTCFGCEEGVKIGAWTLCPYEPVKEGKHEN